MSRVVHSTLSDSSVNISQETSAYGSVLPLRGGLCKDTI